MTSDIAALILMGGQNKRMNGQHKAFLTIDDHTFLEKLICQLADFPHIYLSVDDKQKFSQLMFPMIEDQYASIGPIGGIASALGSVSEDYLFVTACDMPFINRAYAAYLKEQLKAMPKGTDCIVLCDDEGFFYPLGAIYSKSMLPLMLEMIKEGNYRLQYLIRHSRSHVIALSDTPFSEKILSNINTPEDYKRLGHSS